MRTQDIHLYAIISREQLSLAHIPRLTFKLSTKAFNPRILFRAQLRKLSADPRHTTAYRMVYITDVNVSHDLQSRANFDMANASFREIERRIRTVSYTHLTLPTILRV